MNSMQIGSPINMIMILCSVFVISCIIIIFTIYFIRKKRRYAIHNFESMEGREFEFFCADILEKNGFYEVEVTKGSGDYGIDILAEKEGVTYAVQCKRYTSPVGVKAIQEAYSGRDYYDRMVGAVMTNQYFTAPAVEAAQKLKILLWDGDYISSIIEGD